MDRDPFEAAIARWGLARDGAPIVTRGSRLLPVRYRDAPAMLKIAIEAEEQRGAALMVWWAGDGAAAVLAEEGDALLLERAAGARSLVDLARGGGDDAATRIICGAVAKLHRPRSTPLASLVPLARWFRQLQPAATAHGGVLTAAAETAAALLATPHDKTVLHGDIHHGNILDFGTRGWLAIDPKGLVGERGFDYANLFCNPDHAIAVDTVLFTRRLAIVSDAAGIAHERLLRWILAYAGLSAAWDIEDGLDPATALSVAGMAAAALKG